MSRQRRIRLPNIATHIVQRGNNRGRVFVVEADYWFYYHQLVELSALTGCAVHAYVLMPNHVHLLATPSCERGVSALMKHLAQRHAQFINRTHKRTGALWEGRFYSNLVEDGAYVLNCHRYIEMNPVRAGLAGHPSSYPWSSYRVNAEGAGAEWMSAHRTVARLGFTAAERLAAYRRLFEMDLDSRDIEAIRETVRGGHVLGNEAFKRQVAAISGRPAAPRKPGPKPRQQALGLEPNLEFGV